MLNKLNINYFYFPIFFLFSIQACHDITRQLSFIELFRKFDITSTYSQAFHRACLASEENNINEINLDSLFENLDQLPQEIIISWKKNLFINSNKFETKLSTVEYFKFFFSYSAAAKILNYLLIEFPIEKCNLYENFIKKSQPTFEEKSILDQKIHSNLIKNAQSLEILDLFDFKKNTKETDTIAFVTEESVKKTINDLFQIIYHSIEKATETK